MNIVKLHDNRITLINGDSAEVMKKIKAESIDLTVTSPPYDDLRMYNGYSFDFETIAKELLRITKIGGTIVWVVADSTKNGNESGTSFRQALYFKEIGFNLHDTMIYEKSGIPPYRESDKRYVSIFEYMFILTKGTIKTGNLLKDKVNLHGGTIASTTRREKNNITTKRNDVIVQTYGIRTNIWRITRKILGDNSVILNKHPAIFPEQLAHDHILSWSNENDVIFDPFLGSGTTAKMAIKLNRRFIGIELSETYFNDIAIPRCNATIAELNNVVQ